MKRMASSGMMQNINKNDFSNILTLIPSYDEEVKIGHLFFTIDKVISYEQNYLNTLFSLKQKYLEDLFI